MPTVGPFEASVDSVLLLAFGELEKDFGNGHLSCLDNQGDLQLKLNFNSRSHACGSMAISIEKQDC